MTFYRLTALALCAAALASGQAVLPAAPTKEAPVLPPTATTSSDESEKEALSAVMHEVEALRNRLAAVELSRAVNEHISVFSPALARFMAVVSSPADGVMSTAARSVGDAFTSACAADVARVCPAGTASSLMPLVSERVATTSDCFDRLTEEYATVSEPCKTAANAALVFVSENRPAVVQQGREAAMKESFDAFKTTCADVVTYQCAADATAVAPTVPEGSDMDVPHPRALKAHHRGRHHHRRRLHAPHPRPYHRRLRGGTPPKPRKHDGHRRHHKRDGERRHDRPALDQPIDTDIAVPVPEPVAITLPNANRRLHEGRPHGGDRRRGHDRPPRAPRMPDAVPVRSGDEPVPSRPSLPNVPAPAGVPQDLANCVAMISKSHSGSVSPLCRRATENLVTVGMHVYGIAPPPPQHFEDLEDEDEDESDDCGHHRWHSFHDDDDEDGGGGFLFLVIIVTVSVLCCVRRRKMRRNIMSRLHALESFQRAQHNAAGAGASAPAPRPAASAPQRQPSVAMEERATLLAQHPPAHAPHRQPAPPMTSMPVQYAQPVQVARPGLYPVVPVGPGVYPQQ